MRSIRAKEQHMMLVLYLDVQSNPDRETMPATIKNCYQVACLVFYLRRHVPLGTPSSHNRRLLTVEPIEHNLLVKQWNKELAFF